MQISHICEAGTDKVEEVGAGTQGVGLGWLDAEPEIYSTKERLEIAAAGDAAVGDVVVQAICHYVVKFLTEAAFSGARKVKRLLADRDSGDDTRCIRRNEKSFFIGVYTKTGFGNNLLDQTLLTKSDGSA